MDTSLISRKTCPLIAFLLISSFFLILLDGTLYAQQGKGHLHVTSQPSQAMIYIDSEFTNSRTPPQKLIELEPGDYRLGVVKNGYKLFEDKINIRTGEVLEINIILSKADSEEQSRLGSEQYIESYLSVRSTPSGADVYLDNERIGITPVKDYKILPSEPRNKNLKITASDHKPYEDVIEWSTIKERVKIHVSAKLEQEIIEPETKAKPETKTKAKPRKDPLSKKKKRFAMNTNVIVFVALLIVVIAVLVFRIVIRLRQRSDEE